MSYIKTWNFRMDAIKQYIGEAINIIRQDTYANKFIITCLSNGYPIDLTDMAYASVTFTKADDFIVVATADIVDALKGRLEVMVDYQAITSIGICTVSVKLHYNSGSIVTLHDFPINVMLDPYTGAGSVVSNSQYPILTQLIIDVNEAKDVIGPAAEAETIRLANEIIRVSNEDARVTSESARASAESTRSTNESARVTNEAGRGTAESTRVTNENARLSNESSRVTAEGFRVEAEIDRNANEIIRNNGFTSAMGAEATRIIDENDRISEEGIRNFAEQDRVLAESNRVTAETARSSAENTRAANEVIREQFEFKGEYVAGTAYLINNVVSYNGSSYVCIANSTGNVPTNATYWKLVAQKGADGTGVGDMLKATYDTTDNGIVDNAEKLGGQLPAYYATAASVTAIELEAQTIDFKITNSFNADIDAYFGNVKTIDDFQDISGLYGSSGSITLSEDAFNVKIGKSSLRITENGNISRNIVVSKNIAIDLSKLNNGEESTENDYLTIVAYVSNGALIQKIGLSLSQDAPYSSTNRKYITGVPVVTGWNFLKIKKSDFLTAGTGAWGGVQSLRSEAMTEINAQNAYISFQLIQLVKKDPILDIPNPFQKNGVREFAINSGEWFVGNEFGEIIIKELANTSNVAHLIGQKTFNNFTIYSKKEVINSSVLEGYITWYTDANNYVSIYVASDLLSILSRVSGVNTTVSTSFDISSGDILEYTLNKNGSNLSLLCSKNGTTPKEITITSSLTSGYLSVGASTVGTKLFSASITELLHAHHADIAEVAKGLTEQARCLVYSSVAQSVAHLSPTLLTFDTERYDNRQMFSVAESTKVKIMETGLYTLSACVCFAVNATGYREVGIRKNGTTILIDQRQQALTVDNFVAISTQDVLKSGDYLELLVLQSSGGALDVKRSVDSANILAVSKIG